MGSQSGKAGYKVKETLKYTIGSDIISFYIKNILLLFNNLK